MSTVISKVNPPTLPDAPSLGYSQISVCTPGKMVFISGQVAWRVDGTPVPDDLEAQAEIAITNVVHALDAVGATVANITSVRMYLVNPTLEDFQSVAPVLKPFFGDVIPTFTAVGVTLLGGEGLKIELEVTAVV